LGSKFTGRCWIWPRQPLQVAEIRNWHL
jgi:hypothetical protein